jgi:hypothetical protein
VGPASVRKLRDLGCDTVADVRDLDPRAIRKNMTVIGKHLLSDGRVYQPNPSSTRPHRHVCLSRRTSNSTFFGASVNDEIERRLFGDIDTRG